MTASVLQSVLDPAGPQAAHISRLWWLMFWVCAAVFVVVLAMVGWSIVRAARARRVRRRESTTPERPDVNTERADRWLGTAVVASTALTIVILLVLLVASVWTGRAMSSLGAASAVSIKVTGHQWWWQVDYEAGVPSQRVTTANEIHIPVGQPVVLKVTSSDVIHSFWVPNLDGKRDLIPGYTTAIWIQADRPGVYRGQCAEFCGYEHAKMALYVTAEDGTAFSRWLADQRKPAATPQNADERQGRDVFLRSSCTQCHTIRGTIAGAVLGPDLTHVATRGTIAAGLLPNTPGHLAGWIADPQRIKPGNRMPPNSIDGEDLQALLTYLESLR